MHPLIRNLTRPSLLLAAALSTSIAPSTAQATDTCDDPGLDVVILGSGGPELSDRRASTGYLVRERGKARFIIDFGAGAALNFERAGGRIEDLHALLFTHFHVDHVNDLPALVKAAFFSDRDRDLPIYGPNGNHLIPATPTFVQRQFGRQGIYPYLSGFLDGSGAFSLKPIAVDAGKTGQELFSTQIDGFTLKAITVEHGRLPSLGWRLEKNGCAVTISGDTSNQGRSLEILADKSDLLIAHNAVPENSRDQVALSLHMTPAEIGRIAQTSGSRSVVLSHFMQRTDTAHAATAAAIARQYRGRLSFAADCDVYSLKTGKKTGHCRH